MYRHGLVLTILLLAACQSVSNSHLANEEDYIVVAQKYSCEDISKEIDRMEAILKSGSPSETERLFTNTAVSAAQTGLNMSGVLGSAGAFAGIGINFIQGLYSMNAKKRQQEIKDIALAQQNILLDAYYHKDCSV